MLGLHNRMPVTLAARLSLVNSVQTIQRLIFRRFIYKLAAALAWLFTVNANVVTMLMKFEWDEAKRRTNLRKHGVDFRDCPAVFAGRCKSVLDDRDYGETRYLTVGLLDDVVIVISHTESDGRIRIISARKAERHERESYFEEIWK